MEMRICENHLTWNVTINTERAGWENDVKSDIRSCVNNHYIHNRIECNGQVVFKMSDFIRDVYNPVCDAHRVKVPYDEYEIKWMKEDGTYKGDYYERYDSEAIQKALIPYEEEEVEKVFAIVCKLNGIDVQGVE